MIKKFNEWLNESSINDYEKMESAFDIKKFIDDFENDYDEWFDSIVSKYEDEERKKKSADEKNFNDWLEYELQFEFDNQRNKIKGYIKNGKITLYRKLLVNKNWLDDIIKNKDNVGIYWAWDKGAAEPHAGYGDKNKQTEVTLKTTIKENDVNWKDTLRLALLGFITGDEEDEIRLNKNVKLKIEEIEVEDKKQSLDKIKNIVFKT